MNCKEVLQYLCGQNQRGEGNFYVNSQLRPSPFPVPCHDFKLIKKKRAAHTSGAWVACVEEVSGGGRK
jgi:hypothetical protein